MKIIPALTGPMSGKLGGIVASRNRGGQYFRRRSTPVNPNSQLQTEVRANFATLVSYWNNELDDSERQTWALWAANTPRLDSLGQTHVLTAQNAFIGFNSLRIQASLSILKENTGAYNRGEAISAASISYVNGPPVELDLALTYGANPSAAGVTLIYQGRPQNQTVNFYKGPYRFVRTYPITAGVPFTAFNMDPDDLPFPPGEDRNFPIRIVNLYNDGRYTNGFESIMPLGTIPPP